MTGLGAAGMMVSGIVVRQPEGLFGRLVFECLASCR